MTIAFVHENKAILPEISAYSDFFSANGIHCETVSARDIAGRSYEVEWHFMGTQTKRENNGAVVIHEYASASTPPFGNLKDFIKRRVNCIPDYRIFNNAFIKSRFDLHDNIPSGIRDYGFPSNMPAKNVNDKNIYDFIYVGTVDKRRKIELLIDCFDKGKMKDHSLLVLSRNYEHLIEKYGTAANIHFKGPVQQKEVYGIISQARYGINYMPDISPYNRQTSAKLIDYCACGVPVLSTHYKWVGEFEKEFGGNFFYLDKDLGNFNWQNITRHKFAIPEMGEWTWENQIKKSGIPLWLKSKFPHLPF